MTIQEDSQAVLNILQEAHRLIQGGNQALFEARLAEARLRISSLDDPPGLLGEWELAGAISQLNHPGRMIPGLKRAWSLLQRPSRVIPEGAPLGGPGLNPIYYFYEGPGEADKTAAELTEVVSLYNRLTGGGVGTDVFYKGQLAYFRGDFSRAKRLLEDALDTYLRRGEEINALYAAYYTVGLAKHGYSEERLEEALTLIRMTSEGKRGNSPFARETAQILRADIYLSIGLIQHIPDWIKNGDFGVISWNQQDPPFRCYKIEDEKIHMNNVPSALLVRIQYFNFIQKPVEALNLIDMAEKIFEVPRTTPLVRAYYELLRASCYGQLKEYGRMMACLKKAMTFCGPDGFWLIPAELSPAFKELLIREVSAYGDDARRCFERIGQGFWDKLGPLRKLLYREGLVSRLTPRELEVAFMAGNNLPNTDIAKYLSITERTVKYHLTNIYAKLRIKRRSQIYEALRMSSDSELAYWVTEDFLRKNEGKTEPDPV